MTLATFGVVLFAAALHATWNAIVKGGSDKLLTASLVTGSAGILSMVILPFLKQPDPASWPFILASTVFQICYFRLLALNYQRSEMSLAYPIMRGTAPLIVTLVSVLILHVELPPVAALGIVVICSGVLSLAISHGRGNGQSVALALLNACVIAGYTLIDGEGVRRSGAPAAYTLWLYVLTGPALIAWALIVHRSKFVPYARANWVSGLIGGIGTATSYGLALWAMTMAPVAVVSALRETSILFGILLSATILHERVDRRRIIAACVIASGAIALRLS